MRRPAGLLLDLDGTVYEDDGAIPGTPDAIARLRELGIPLRFVTNTTRVPRDTIEDWLEGFGIAATADEVFTPPLAAVAWLVARDIERIAVCLPEHALVEFSDFDVTDDAPEAVVIGDLGAGWDFATMNRVFRWLLDGAAFVALHRNRYWKTAEGLTLDVGAFVAAFEYASGRQAELVGKPSAAMFEAAAASMDLEPDEVAMVGDDLQSDVAGAQVIGAAGILVRTGKFRLEELERSSTEPDLVVESLAALPEVLSGMTTRAGE